MYGCACRPESQIRETGINQTVHLDKLPETDSSIKVRCKAIFAARIHAIVTVKV